LIVTLQAESDISRCHGAVKMDHVEERLRGQVKFLKKGAFHGQSDQHGQNERDYNSLQIRLVAALEATGEHGTPVVYR